MLSYKMYLLTPPHTDKIKRMIDATHKVKRTGGGKSQHLTRPELNKFTLSTEIKRTDKKIGTVHAENVATFTLIR